MSDKTLTILVELLAYYSYISPILLLVVYMLINSLSSMRGNSSYIGYYIMFFIFATSIMSWMTFMFLWISGSKYI